MAQAQRIVEIQNLRGLHARASAKFVQCAEQFPDAEVTVLKDNDSVSALSIMGLMMLAAAKGSFITLQATGTQALEALNALEALVNDKFHEGE